MRAGRTDVASRGKRANETLLDADARLPAEAPLRGTDVESQMRLRQTLLDRRRRGAPPQQAEEWFQHRRPAVDEQVWNVHET